MQVFKRPPQSEDSSHSRILKAAQRLFACQGFDSTTTIWHRQQALLKAPCFVILPIKGNFD